MATVTLKLRTLIVGVALLCVLAGMALSHLGSVSARGYDLQARQLSEISATLYEQKNYLKNIEAFTERSCKALQGHRFGTCSPVGPAPQP